MTLRLQAHVLVNAHVPLAALETVREEMVNTQVSLSAQLETVPEGMEPVREGVETVREGMEAVPQIVETVRIPVETVHGVREGMGVVPQIVETGVLIIEEKQIKTSEQDESLCDPPDAPSDFLGFGDHIKQLKKFVLEDGVNVVGVTAMGGAGKSTLAAAICNDDEISEYFKQRVLYIVVSESPDHLGILKTMWRNIVGGRAPDFINVDDAHNRLQSQIKSIKKPTLLVLDDIWSKFHLEKLLFEGEQYTTLVTTRDINVMPKGPKTCVYELPILQPEHALSLFCHCAFGKPIIPIGRDKELVEKVQQECNGLPLVLKVIGSSLYGKPDSVWERVEKRLSAGEPFKDDHKDFVLNKLKTSIDVLDDIEKQCFLDLGAFPQSL